MWSSLAGMSRSGGLAVLGDVDQLVLLGGRGGLDPAQMAATGDPYADQRLEGRLVARVVAVPDDRTVDVAGNH